MFAFPKQQQKSCCVLEHARAASLLPLFLCTTRACFHPLLDVKEGFPMYLRSLETITMSLRRLQGKNSTSFMLFLRFFDFDDADDSQDEALPEQDHGLPSYLDLDSGIQACLGWYLLAKAARPSVTISFSPFLEGAVLFIPLK